jgi:tRNA:m4X modification enzyme
MANIAECTVPDNSGLNVANIQGRCRYYLPRKKRVCRLMAASGRQFCGEHLIFEEKAVKLGEQGKKIFSKCGASQRSKKLGCRIWCPLDPHHTVDEHDLERHMKRCNARPKPKADHMVVDLHLNSSAAGQTREYFEIPHLAEISDASISHVLQFLNSHQIPLRPYYNRPLEAYFQDRDERIGTKQGKHPIQYASLLRHLRDTNLLLRESVFVEVGAGKGNLNSC